MTITSYSLGKSSIFDQKKGSTCILFSEYGRQPLKYYSITEEKMFYGTMQWRTIEISHR